MKENFARIMTFVFKWEGGYCHDKDDPGGETNLGINKRDHPKEDIKHMTRERALDIYRESYWKPAGCDELPWPLDLVTMDAAVNCGVSKAEGWLASAMKTIPANVPGMIDARDSFYRTLATKKPTMKKFLRGWLNRTRDLRKLAESPK